MVPREGRPRLLVKRQSSQAAAAINKRNLITAEQPSGQSNRARTAGVESSSEMLTLVRHAEMRGDLNTPRISCANVMLRI